MFNSYNPFKEADTPIAEILSAAQDRRWLDVYRLLNAGVDLNVSDTEGRSVLWLVAAHCTDEDLIIEVINKGAKLNASAFLEGEKFSISVTQLLKKREFNRAYNKLISMRSMNIVAYVHLSTEYVCNHIEITFYDHNLDYGLEIDPDTDEVPKCIRRATLLRRLKSSYAAFAFKANITSLSRLLVVDQKLRTQNRFYSLFNGNCADLVEVLAGFEVLPEIETCDFLAWCLPPIPSTFDCITNPNNIFKRIYARVRDSLLFEHNMSLFGSSLAIGDFLPYFACCLPMHWNRDFDGEISAIEAKLYCGKSYKHE